MSRCKNGRHLRDVAALGGYLMETPKAACMATGSMPQASKVVQASLKVGMTLKPQNNDRLSINMGLQGYVGQREGIAGSVKVNYAF